MRATHSGGRARWWRCVCALGFLALVFTSSAIAEELDPLSLTKYIDPLPIPGVAEQAAPNYYEIGAWQIQQQLHSQLPPTTVFAYGTSEATAGYPGPTIVVQRNVPIQVKWTNNLGMTHPLSYAFDPTIPAAVTTTGVPITTHVHGAEVEPQSDGGPMTWYTPGYAETGPDYAGPVKTYVNTQLASTIWYHDHAFGYTRHNVYAGLAGYYIVTDPGNEPVGLPQAPYDMGICIQDRMFTTDGQLWYPNEGESEVHPVWIPEFFGDVILVNGKVWPYLEVEARKYRFRFLNGAQARFFSLALAERVTSQPGPEFYQIATDGGYLAEPVLLNAANDPHSPRLLMAPGERCEVVVDFSAYAPGTEFILKNNAKAPYPNGETPDAQTTAQIMLFRVIPATSPDQSIIPAQLATMTRLTNPTVTRVMTLNEMMQGDAPVGALLNGMDFHMPATEFPALGTTEMWEVVNMTGDTHPIHLHLVQFQILNRQRINVRKYEHAFMNANPEMPSHTYVPVSPSGYLKGKPIPPDANERGWKDTFRMNPGEVTRILVRWAPQDETPTYSFDATAAPGYVWHCHILEHEENDMMRPFHLVAAGPAPLLTDALAVNPPAVAETGVRLSSRNPVSGSTTVHFSLKNPSEISLDLYNVAGERVSRIAEGWYGAGEHTVPWSRTADSGQRLGAGIYFMQFKGDGILRSHKVVLTP